MMTHEGYTAAVFFESDDHAFHGTVLGIRDVIHFTGSSVDELELAFKESVDEYLAVCDERGIQAQKPMSGKLSLRISPALHLQVTAKAKQSGKSINAYLENVISESL